MAFQSAWRAKGNCIRDGPEERSLFSMLKYEPTQAEIHDCKFFHLDTVSFERQTEGRCKSGSPKNLPIKTSPERMPYSWRFQMTCAGSRLDP